MQTWQMAVFFGVLLVFIYMTLNYLEKIFRLIERIAADVHAIRAETTSLSERFVVDTEPDDFDANS